MKTWMEAFMARMRQAFGDRLAFVGLQGSRARGEATPKSDIDVVVVLDGRSWPHGKEATFSSSYTIRFPFTAIFPPSRRP